MKKYEKILLSQPFFAGIAEEDMEKVLSCLSAKMQEYERGSVLFRQGEKMEQMGIVLEGSISLEKEDFWGNRSILAIVEAREVFGEVYACRKERTLNINVTAQYRTKVLLLDLTPVLDRREGEGPGKEEALYEKLTVNLVHILADKTWSMARKTEYLSGRGIREKVEAYLSAQAQMAGEGDFIIPLNRQELADFLAVDRSALSRELGKMRREGILDYRKNHFRLLAADRLPD